MEGVYPVIINGGVCGKLKVEKAGGYTRFIADCPMHSEVIRLSVYGDGKEGYLGVPLPKDGRLCLDKKFSPAAMRDFPQTIDHCALAGEKPEPEPEPESCTDVEKECTEIPEAECKVEHEDADEDKGEDIDDDDEEGPFWYATTDGALVSRSGEQEMVALPRDDERVPHNIPGQPRIIEGKEYLVYITKEI